MLEKMKKIAGDPFAFAVYMLMIAYLGAPVFLKVHLGVFRKAGLVWGAGLLFIFFIKNIKMYFKNKYAAALLLFCFVNGITILVNWRVKLSSNIFSFGYFVTSLLLVFNMFYQCEKEEVERKIRLFGTVNVIFPLIYAAIALLTFVFCINGYYEYKDGYQYFGMYQNRLWGLFNPNTGGMMAVISMAFSGFLMHRFGKKKLYIVNMVVQYIYLILTQSRSAYAAFLFLIGIVILFVIVDWKKIAEEGQKGYAKGFLKAIVLFLLIVLMAPVTKKVAPLVPQAYSRLFASENDDEEIAIERVEEFGDNAESLSNGRTRIWSAGIEVWKKSPVWGVGANSISEYGEQYLDEGTAQALRNGGLHNVYITTLVASGIVGLSVFLLFLTLVLVRFLKYLFKGKEKSLIILMALCGGILLSDLMESRILYANSSVHYIFWSTLGLLCHNSMYKLERS